MLFFIYFGWLFCDYGDCQEIDFKKQLNKRAFFFEGNSTMNNKRCAPTDSKLFYFVMHFNVATAEQLSSFGGNKQIHIKSDKIKCSPVHGGVERWEHLCGPSSDTSVPPGPQTPSLLEKTGQPWIPGSFELKRPLIHEIRRASVWIYWVQM